MLKKDIAISVFLFATALLVDLIWKLQIISDDVAHINRGFIFGSLQDLPASLTLVTLCSIGGFLIFLYTMLILLLPKNVVFLKAGLGLLAGGVLANVIDRSVHGGTLDFIPMEFPFLPPIVFNPADAFQWVGAAIVGLKIVSKEKTVWYPESKRAFHLVNPSEQIKFALKFAIISMCSSLIIGVFSLSYLTLTISSFHIHSKAPMIGFALSFIAISLFCTLISFLAGLLISQRVAGPLFAFERYIDSIIKGEDRTLKLREGDSFKDLERIAKNISEHVKSKN